MLATKYDLDQKASRFTSNFKRGNSCRNRLAVVDFKEFTSLDSGPNAGDIPKTM